jgi:phospholipid/cholesterol/gamma-HCH transport system ATP-binding protein
MAIPLIEFRNVRKQFDDDFVLDGVDFQAYEGQVTVIIGKSGTGKTVLLKHIIGLLEPDSGSILFKGKPVAEMSKKEKNIFFRQFSYMFQGNALFDSMTVLENVALPLQEVLRLSKKKAYTLAMERIRQVELGDVIDKYPSELSGGMQKRAALARALVTDPAIVLFDEPTTGQDPIRKNAILSMIAQSKKKFGYSAIVISHEIPDILFISDRVIILWEGKVAFQGTWLELQRQKLPIAAEYLESLEGFEDQLTGLMSKQMFRNRYKMALANLPGVKSIVIVVFSVELDLITEKIGAEAAMRVISRLGEFISSQLNSVGGFSTRQQRDHILTVFPQLSYGEVVELVDKFSSLLQGCPLHDIQSEAQEEIHSDNCFNIIVYAGIAEIASNEPLEEFYHKAAANQKIIAQFKCDEVGGCEA